MFKKSVLVFALGVLVVSVLTSAQSIETTQSSSVLFFDDFNDGVLDGWTEHLGAWSIVDVILSS